MELTVTYLGGVQFEAEARGHKIYSDQPHSNNGFDEGMTPPELLLAAVGTCAGYYAAEYLNKQGLPAAGLRIKGDGAESAEASTAGAVHGDGGDAGRERGGASAGVKLSVEKCLVKNTLQIPAEIAVDVVGDPAAGA